MSKIRNLIIKHNKDVKREIDKIREPDFMMVITGIDNVEYTTENGYQLFL